MDKRILRLNLGFGLSYMDNGVIESRLSTLESKIDKLIERNFKNIGLICEQSKKKSKKERPSRSVDRAT